MPTTLSTLLDTLLLTPFRLPADPLLGYLLGSAAIALAAAAASRATLALARRGAGPAALISTEDARRYQQLSMRALAAGDGDAYRACNRLANDAFGRSFFQHAAWSMGSLWPVFLAAAWIEDRFGAVRVPLGALELSPLAPLVLCYIAARILLAKLAGLSGTALEIPSEERR